jgi:hypothetical protein
VALEPKKRLRRSPEQLIADLEAKIADLRTRAQIKSLKDSPAAKAAIAALRAIDKGLDLAAGDSEMSKLRFALADARKPLAAYLEEQGVKLHKPRMPRGRRPGAAAAAN